jgi:hypothetical protein
MIFGARMSFRTVPRPLKLLLLFRTHGVPADSVSHRTTPEGKCYSESAA